MPSISLSLSKSALANLVCRQVNQFFPDDRPVVDEDIVCSFKSALERLEHCFVHVANKYFFDGKSAVFNHLHGDQNAIWLYFLANTLYREGASADVCAKIFLLNKALHGCDIFYEVELPSIFLLVHPLGTVLGRGNYSDYFVAYQRCGIGSNRDIYPTLGAYVTLRPGSAILGNSTIGQNCQIAAESLVLDCDLPENTLYIGQPKTAHIKQNLAHYPLWRVQQE